MNIRIPNIGLIVFSAMIENLRDKTIEYLQTLKTNPTINEFDYEDVIRVLSEKILHEDYQKINAEIQTIENSKNKCTSCGCVLESWERKICGPCRIKDPNFSEELDE